MISRIPFKIDTKFWNKYEYPCTIIADRYNGAYSGGSWTAWPCDEYEVPRMQAGDDGQCMQFWSKVDKNYIGIGNTPQEAFEDLKKKLRNH